MKDWGIEVKRALVPQQMIDQVLLRMHLELKHHGLPPVGALAWPHDPFESLRQHPVVMAVADFLTDELEPRGELILPLQLVWQLPDEAPDDYPLTPHVDSPPPSKRYTMIAGVAFSEWTARNGALHVWLSGMPEPVELLPGDVVLLDPATQHSPGLNRSPLPRMGMYVRWAETV